MLMRKLLCLLAVVFCAGAALAAEADWMTDMSAAKKKAKAENKRILILFTGSDWCPMCKIWDKEVFENPDFISYASTNLVLVMADFPEKRPLPRAQQRANDALRDKYDPKEFPEAVVLDPNGKKVVGRLRYEPGGLPRMIKFLNGEKVESTLPKKE
jgi:thioredoxin-related protein